MSHIEFVCLSYTWLADNLIPLPYVTVYIHASMYISFSVHVYMYTNACGPEFFSSGKLRQKSDAANPETLHD